MKIKLICGSAVLLLSLLSSAEEKTKELKDRKPAAEESILVAGRVSDYSYKIVEVKTTSGKTCLVAIAMGNSGISGATTSIECLK